MRLIDIVGAVAFAGALYGCKADPPAAAAPARIVEPTPESRAELKRVVSQALNGVDVTLADDALTHESLLNIDQKTYRDARGNPINGRQLGRPIQFVLLKEGEQCVLELRGSGQRWSLPATKCTAE